MTDGIEIIIVVVWKNVESVSPIPECPTPDHGNRGLTRSQQFQYTDPERIDESTCRARAW